MGSTPRRDVVPHSVFRISLLPIPYSLFPIPYSPFPSSQHPKQTNSPNNQRPGADTLAPTFGSAAH